MRYKTSKERRLTSTGLIVNLTNRLAKSIVSVAVAYCSDFNRLDVRITVTASSFAGFAGFHDEV